MNSSETLWHAFSVPYVPGQSLADLPLLSLSRFLLSLLVLLISSSRFSNVSELRPDMEYSKPNLEKVEKEEERLEEDWLPFIKRFVRRPMFVTEVASTFSLFFVCAKCLSRLLAGAGVGTLEYPWWSSVACAFVFSFLEVVYIGAACNSVVGRLRGRRLCGREGELEEEEEERTEFSLTDPLLGADSVQSMSSNCSSPTDVTGLAVKDVDGKLSGDNNEVSHCHLPSSCSNNFVIAVEREKLSSLKNIAKVAFFAPFNADRPCFLWLMLVL